MTSAAIIVAGGSGVRAGGEIPKQFQPLLGVPLIVWPIRFFSTQPLINQIIVVCHSDYLELLQEILAHEDGSCPLALVAGGKRRQDSVLAGVEAAGEAELVFVHDAARPFPPSDLSAAGEAARIHGCAIYASRVTDSIKKAHGKVVEHAVPRDDLWAAQTPQVAVRELLYQALLQCAESGTEVTDEASALEQIGVPTVILESTRSNIKITLPEDWLVAEAIARTRGMQQLPNSEIGKP